MNYLIISFISKDRPGIVETLSDVISQHQGNWQKSSLHHMSGVFAGVIEIACPSQHLTALSEQLTTLAGFKMQVEQVEQDFNKPETQLILELTANDRAGIVQEISTVIHQYKGNLLKLVSTKETAPHAGHELFKAKASVAVNDTDIEHMIDALENLADDLMVDISR